MRRTARETRRFMAMTLLVAFAAPLAGAQEGGWLTLGDKAPELKVDFIQGEPITLEEGLGKNVFIVEFWATWCGPCRYTIPHLNELQKKYEDDGLVVIGISDEPAEVVRPYVKKRGDEMTYRVAVDQMEVTNNRFFRSFGQAHNFPHAFVVDGNGRVAWMGHPGKPFLEELVQYLLEDLPRIRQERAAKKAESDEKAPERADLDE